MKLKPLMILSAMLASAAYAAATMSGTSSGSLSFGNPVLTAASLNRRSLPTLSAPAAATTPSGSSPPVIFNAPASTAPGDIIGLQGYNFGSETEVRAIGADGGRRTLSIVSKVGDWASVQIPSDIKGAIVLEVASEGGVSAPVALNGARAYHMDTLQIVPGGTFRIFGRSLTANGYAPSVRVDGAAATIILSQSDEHMLTVVAPPNLGATAAAAVMVDNGNGSGASLAERSVQVITGLTGTPFGDPTGWTAVFSPLMSRVIPVPCTGQVASQQIQDAVETLSRGGGGVVQLGAGTCTIAQGIGMRDNIVLQGQGKGQTILRYVSNYPIWAERLNRIALRNLTLINAGNVEEGPLFKNNDQIVIQNVRFELGTSRQAFFTSNRNMLISGCGFNQTGSVNQQSPYLFNGSRGLIFVGNYTQFVMGAAAFERISDAYIFGNMFARDARAQYLPGALHMLTIDFASRVAIVGNAFKTVNGAIRNTNRNDGEAVLTEGGGPNRTEGLGTVLRASAATIYDPGLTLNKDPFNEGRMPENYGIAIVGGKGTGQTRTITAVDGATLTVDRPWGVVPDVTSRYATFVWGLEKSTIKRNMFADMPRGIWIYQAAVRDVDIIGNDFEEGGGVYLRSYQNVARKMFDPIYNVRVADNHVANTLRNWMSYVMAIFVNSDARAFGMAMTGIEIRQNMLVANKPNLSSRSEEYAGAEGYFNMMRVENYAGYEPMSVPRILGTIFQKNGCTNCATNYRIGTGAGGSVIAGSRQIGGGLLMENWKTTSNGEVATDTVVN